MAKLEIDSVKLEAYKAALREEIDTSIRIEPGVLTLYAIALKKNPAHIRILETYADVAAYKAHIKTPHLRETPHFKKYKNLTQNMVKSLRLVETDPIVLGVNARSTISTACSGLSIAMTITSTKYCFVQARQNAFGGIQFGE